MVYGPPRTIIYLQDLSRDSTLQSEDGKTTLPAVTIFSHAIRFLGQHLLKQLRLETGEEVPPDLIRWVLTVPAIWKDKAKQFMREAFYMVIFSHILTCSTVISLARPSYKSYETYMCTLYFRIYVLVEEHYAYFSVYFILF